MDRRNKLRSAKMENENEKQKKLLLKTMFNPELHKQLKLQNELKKLHSEWKQTITDSSVNISQLKNQINVVNLQTTSKLQETETNYRKHLKEVEDQYKNYCIKIKNENNDYILSIRNNSNNEIKNIKDEISEWENKLRTSRSKWKTLKTQIETMKINKEQI